MYRFFAWKTFAAFVLWGAYVTGKAQNLVVNPSFESVVQANLQCDPYISADDFNWTVNNWRSPTEGSPDLYHTSLPNYCVCSPAYNGTTLITGQPAPRTGDAYVGFITYVNFFCEAREYVEGRLSTPLTVGQAYLVEMYVATGVFKGDASMSIAALAANNIGIKFGTDSVTGTSSCLYPAVPDLNYSGAPIIDTTGWTRIAFCYTPTVPGLRYLMIGNFLNNASTDTVRISPGDQIPTAYYFLDDVRVEAIREPDPGTGGLLTVCPGQAPVNLFDRLGTTASTAGTWSGPSTLSGGHLGTFRPGVDLAGTFRYTVTENTICGPRTAYAEVTVSPGNAAPVITQPAGVCPGGPAVQLTANIPGGSWAASCGNCISPGGLFNPPSAGSYTVTYSVGGPCPGSDTMTVTVQAEPVVTAPAPLCADAAAVSFTASQPGGVWTASCGNCISANGLFNPALAGPGTHTVTYTVSGACAGSGSAGITVRPLPDVNASPDATICPGDSITLSASGAVSYTWSPATGLNSTTGASVTAKPVAPVVYTVTGTDANGCTGSDQVSVSLYPGVTAGYSFSPDPAIADVPVQFTDQSQNAVTWDWQFGDNGTSQQQHPVHVYNNGGGYTVVLTVTSADGCKDTASKLIMVMDVTVNIPNIITPNGDGVNDRFEVTAGNQDYKCSIYNRWGNLLFESDSPQTSWDGKTPAGKLVPTGTYFCVIEFTAPTGPYKYEGTVNVHY